MVTVYQITSAYLYAFQKEKGLLIWKGYAILTKPLLE